MSGGVIQVRRAEDPRDGEFASLDVYGDGHNVVKLDGPWQLRGPVPGFVHLTTGDFIPATAVARAAR